MTSYILNNKRLLDGLVHLLDQRQLIRTTRRSPSHFRDFRLLYLLHRFTFCIKIYGLLIRPNVTSNIIRFLVSKRHQAAQHEFQYNFLKFHTLGTLNRFLLSNRCSGIVFIFFAQQFQFPLQLFDESFV